MKNAMNNKLGYFVSLLLVTAAGLFVHRGHFTEEPSGIHTWTQSDHYALARGFQENGLNFFRPETFVYHESPGKEASTVTAVDFPIHNYIPAVFMKLFGTESPAIYRWYLFLISIIGLFYLYRLAFLFNKSAALSLLIVFLVAASPVFTFYQIRFIPSVPSFSTAIIGFYYYFRYRENQAPRTFVISLLFLTLSALTRMTFLIPLLAVCGQEFFYLLRSTNERWKKMGLVVGSVILFLSYTLYNAYLRKQFGGIFLTTFMPADSFADFWETTKQVLRIWKWEYLTKMHYLILALGTAVIIYQILIRRTSNAYVRKNGLLIAFLISGSLAFYVLMVGQFTAHDYYFIDNFLIPITIVSCLASAWITPEGRIAKVSLWVVSIAAIGWMLKIDIATQNARHEQELFGENARVISNFKGGYLLLEQFKVGKDEKIAILDPSPCNLPLLALHRKGYVNMQNNRKALKKAMEFPCEYYVFQNALFPQSIYKFYPEIIGELEVLGTNGRITLCRKKQTGNKSLMTFLKLDKQTPTFEAISGTTKDKWFWETGKFDSIQKCFETDPLDEFDPSIQINDSNFFENGRMLILDGEFKFPNDQDLEWVFSSSENGQLKTYETFSLQYAMTGKGSWKKFLLFLQVPPLKGQGEVASYLYNTKHLKYQYRNLRCRVY